LRAAQISLQGFEVHGLDEMVLEARLAGTDTVGFLAVARDGDQAQAVELG